MEEVPDKKTLLVCGNTVVIHRGEIQAVMAWLESKGIKSEVMSDKDLDAPINFEKQSPKITPMQCIELQPRRRESEDIILIPCTPFDSLKNPKPARPSWRKRNDRHAPPSSKHSTKAKYRVRRGC